MALTTPKRSKTQAQQLAELDKMRTEFEAWDKEIKRREALPPEWAGIEAGNPTIPRKVRMTIRLDGDVAGWFRAQGTGYQKRVNAVLRAYMLAKRSVVL